MASDLGIAIVGGRRVGSSAASGGSVPVSEYSNKQTVKENAERLDAKSKLSGIDISGFQQPRGAISGASKYRNKPVVTPEGERFDSQAEYSRWLVLKLQQKDGRITHLLRQVPFILAPSVQIAGKKRRSPPLRYVADFSYVDSNGERVIEDVKGAVTEGYRIKRHLLAAHGIHITEIKA